MIWCVILIIRIYYCCVVSYSGVIVAVVYDCVMSNMVVVNIVVFVKNAFCHCRTAVVLLIKMNWDNCSVICFRTFTGNSVHSINFIDVLNIHIMNKNIAGQSSHGTIAVFLRITVTGLFSWFNEFLYKNPRITDDQKCFVKIICIQQSVIWLTEVWRCLCWLTVIDS